MKLTKDMLMFKPVTTTEWPDMQRLFGPNGADGGCWCMWWRIKRSEFDRKHGEENRRAMEAIIRRGEVPGQLAYLEKSRSGRGLHRSDRCFSQGRIQRGRPPLQTPSRFAVRFLDPCSSDRLGSKAIHAKGTSGSYSMTLSEELSIVLSTSPWICCYIYPSWRRD